MGKIEEYVIDDKVFNVYKKIKGAETKDFAVGIMAGTAIIEKEHEVLNTENKKEIVELVKKKPLNITQITEKTGLTYRTVWGILKELAAHKYVSLEKNEKVQGRVVMVHYTGDKIEEQIIKAMKRSFKKKEKS